MKVLVTGDWHLDAHKIGRVNPNTDLDLRTEDFLAAVDASIDYAINNHIDIYIMNGDLFKGRTSTHLLETCVAERFQRIANHMRLIINLGNHDYTARSLAHENHTYSVMQRFNIKNMEVNLNLRHIELEKCDLVLYPYYDYKSRSDHEFNDNAELLTFIETEIAKMNLTKDCKLFVGHGTPEGTAMSEEYFLDLGYIDEPIIPKSTLKQFDMVLFSHIHRSHSISKSIFHVGSLERVDFAEASQDKGFAVYDTDAKKMNFISTNPRPMHSVKIDMVKEVDSFTNPTDYLLEKIRSIPELNRSIIKLEVRCSEQVRMEIDDRRVKEALKKSFHESHRYSVVIEERQTRLSEVTEHLSEAEALEKTLSLRSDLSEAERKSILLRGKGVIASNEA